MANRIWITIDDDMKARAQELAIASRVPLATWCAMAIHDAVGAGRIVGMSGGVAVVRAGVSRKAKVTPTSNVATAPAAAAPTTRPRLTKEAYMEIYGTLDGFVEPTKT